MNIIINFPTFVFVKIIMCDSIMTHKFQGLFGKTTLLMWRTIFRILSILVIFLDVNIIWLDEVSDRFRSYVSTILIEFMGLYVFIILTICFDQKISLYKVLQKRIFLWTQFLPVLFQDVSGDDMFMERQQGCLSLSNIIIFKNPIC